MSDTVQIVTLIVGLIGTMWTAWLAFQTAKLKSKIEVVHKATDSLVAKVDEAARTNGEATP